VTSPISPCGSPLRAVAHRCPRLAWDRSLEDLDNAYKKLKKRGRHLPAHRRDAEGREGNDVTVEFTDPIDQSVAASVADQKRRDPRPNNTIS